MCVCVCVCVCVFVCVVEIGYISIDVLNKDIYRIRIYIYISCHGTSSNLSDTLLPPISAGHPAFLVH